ncbi:MAG: cupin domain-containing protein [Planctomycetota bacterium]
MRIPGLDLVANGAELNALPWRSTRYEGVGWLALATSDPDAAFGDSQTVLIRMAPGCGYPTHEHCGPEDVLILAGGYRDLEDGRVLRAGDFHRYPAGSRHTPVALEDESSSAGVLFAVAHGGTQVVRELGTQAQS